MRRLYVVLLVALFIGVLPGCATQDNASGDSVFDDENIEKEALARINSLHMGQAHVNATSFNHRLLLTGQVPSESAKSEIVKIASGVAKARGVSNELVVGDISGIASRTTDSWITSDVKFRLRKSSALKADDFKVTTESGTVFLMGTVHRKEAASAAEIASTSNRVQRVVLVFEYLD